MKLVFPKTDSRSDGKPFNPKRPWLKQGAIGVEMTAPLTVVFNTDYSRPLILRNVTAIKFEKSKDYDLVPPEFLKVK